MNKQTNKMQSHFIKILVIFVLINVSNCDQQHKIGGFCPDNNVNTAECKRIDRTSCDESTKCPADRLCCATLCGGARCISSRFLIQLEPTIVDICSLKVDTGPEFCKNENNQQQHRWFFNSDTKECQQFIFNG
jgi:hypothetical protein